jgi:hypothetical protein
MRLAMAVKRMEHKVKGVVRLANISTQIPDSGLEAGSGVHPVISAVALGYCAKWWPTTSAREIWDMNSRAKKALE